MFFGGTGKRHDEHDSVIDLDYDKESKKQELKQLRKQEISDILDELDDE